MAKNKAQKVDIRIGSSSPDTTDQSKDASNATFGSTPEPVPADGRNRRQESTAAEVDTPDSYTRDGVSEQIDQESDRGTTRESRRDQEPTLDESAPDSTEKDLHTPEGAREDASVAESSQEDSWHDSSDASVYSATDDSDFYSSKLDDARTLSSEQSYEMSRPRGVSAYFRVIVLVFTTTVVAGAAILYQLERIQPGAGLIFDWL